MKKKFRQSRLGIALILAMVLILSLGTAAFADDPDDIVTINWSGAGIVGGSVQAGDDGSVSYQASGDGISGTFTVTDQNDNPYSYGVDTISSYIQSNVINGWSDYQVTRDDSASMYGSAGQTVYAFIGSTGTGSMATGSWTNYAAMTNATYAKPLTPGGHNFEVSGGSYQVFSSLQTANGNYAQFDAVGSGTADIDCMTTGGYGANSIRFGWGGGCYTNADASMTGSGAFDINAVGSSLITPSAGGWTASGDGTPGSVSYHSTLTFGSGATVSDYSLTVQ